jgi:hypothetical protein
MTRDEWKALRDAIEEGWQRRNALAHTRHQADRAPVAAGYERDDRPVIPARALGRRTAAEHG